MSVGSSRKRAMLKAQGLPLRRGLPKGTTGEEKGPGRTPSREDVRQAMRRARKAEKARAEAAQSETKAA